MGEKILTLQEQNIKLEQLIVTLQKELALKEIELREVQEFEERSMSWFHDEKELIDKKTILMER